jgi:hypothetical protein
MVCIIEGCGSKKYCSGMCSKHYNRLIRTGTTEDGIRSRASLEERFWRQVDKRGPDECWEWKAKSRVSGYGVIGTGGRKSSKILAHRLSYIIHKGEIGHLDGYHGMVVMHKCDNRLCVNPRHLVLGSQADNVRDMDAKGRRVNRQLKGSSHPNAKLNEDMVRAIRESDKPNTYWAKEFGVTRQAIRYARLKGWKDG